MIITVVTALAFNYSSLLGKPEVAEKIIVADTVHQVDHTLEIKTTLAKYDSLLSAEIQQSGNVGGAIVITYKGQIAMLKCFGVKKAGEKSPVNEHTIFRLASVSKSVTGVLAGILADEKVIDLDDRVVDYLPNFHLKNPESTNHLTIRHLLSHTSGLIPHAFDLMVEDHVPLDQIINRLNEVDLTANPGEIYGYQNVMFSVFDPITSAKTKKSFHDIITEKVFVPFQMANASTGFEPFKANPNKAFPHYNSNGQFKPMRLNDRYYNTAPAAGVNASISDLGNFLLAVTGENYDLFSENARELVFTPQVVSPLKRTYFRCWDTVDSKEYSIGWRIVNYKNRKVAYHGGYVLGYRAEIAFSEDEEVGIAFLSNSPNSSVARVVPIFLNLLFEHSDKLAPNKEMQHYAAVHNHS